MYIPPPMFSHTSYLIPTVLHNSSLSAPSSQSATFSTNPNTIHKYKDRDITVGIATRYGLEGSRFEGGGSKRFSLLHTRPDPPVQRVPGPFPEDEAAQVWRWPSTPLRLRMSGAIPLLPFCVAGIYLPLHACKHTHITHTHTLQVFFTFQSQSANYFVLHLSRHNVPNIRFHSYRNLPSFTRFKIQATLHFRIWVLA
jgi:hypothetical protein